MILSFLFLTFGFLTPWVSRAHAQSITDRLSGSPTVPWQISAEQWTTMPRPPPIMPGVISDHRKQATRLVADSVSFNQKAMTAVADGHVVMTVGDDILTGGRVELDLDQETGVVHDGTVFLKENHFYIHGERIEKTGKDTYGRKEDPLPPAATATSRTGSSPVENSRSPSMAMAPPPMPY